MMMFAAMFAALVANGDFESGQGADAPGWTFTAPAAKVWRVEPGAGVNGNRGMVWESAHTNIYAFPTQRIALQPGKRYRIEAQVCTRVVKEGPGSHGAGVFLEWYDAQGQCLGSCYPPRVRGTNEWAKIENVTKDPIPGNAAYGVIAPFVHRGCTGWAAFDEIVVEEYGVKPIGGLFSSAYRDIAADGCVRFFAPLFVETNGFTSAGWTATFAYNAADGSRRTVPAGFLSPQFAAIELDVSNLASGTQHVSCTLASADGAVRETANLPFTRVAAFPARKVYVDARRRLIVDGKPFFPLGMFSSVLRPPVVAAYAKGPFNCILPYHAPARKQMDNCEAHGLKFIYAINKTYAGWRSAPKGVKTEADEIRWLEARLPDVKSHPAMLGWYLADELAVSYVPRLAKRRAWLAERDPDHPTFACYCRVDQMREYIGTADVFGTDVYPVPFAPLRKVADVTRQTDAGLFGAFALWQVPQTFSWADTRTTRAKGARFPTRGEMRSMCWQMVAAGANGIISYCLHHCMDRMTGEPTEDRWENVCAVFADLKRFTDVFLAGDEPPAMTGVPPSLVVRTFRSGDDAWVLVCNLEDAVTEATFQVVGATSAGEKVYGVGAEMVGGKVRVAMPPYEVCLLKTEMKGTTR